GDEGAEALLKSPATAKLRFLDLHHHYCSDEMMEKLKALGIKVDLSDAQGECDQDDRYVEVGE
ncbi:MAG TPA: molybdenum metabolism regulator, partial [Acidobacteriota bacterium]|nr:molybdenum metabolism regulator [Acidobacteriota bacterium]